MKPVKENEDKLLSAVKGLLSRYKTSYTNLMVTIKQKFRAET